ncbi:MAG: hypothetical protein GY715_13220 [Planctomycetes bacterium]|nr:hypothetical protein [Planctomycetota bacterium]
MKVQVLCAPILGLAFAIASTANAEVIVHDSWSSWSATVAPITTLDFTGFPNNTVITDQYTPVGATFMDAGDRVFVSSVFEKDGAGLNGGFSVAISLEGASQAFAIDVLGLVKIELFNDGTRVYESELFSGGGGSQGYFVGLVADQAFDTVVLTGPGGVFLDDTHFTAAPLPAPSALGLLMLAGIAGRRRRR